MNTLTRCYSCMTTLDGDSACPSCGCQAGSEPDNPLYLPAGYLLNNRYLIGTVIGTGGFGIVYIAWDQNLEIKVAVKEFLPKEYAARSSDHVSILPYAGSAKEEFTIGAEKFLDEAKALARFQDHPGIVTVHESFRTNNTAYMVMQFLDGVTLKEYLKRQPGEKMPFNMAVKAMIPVMDALKEVHKAGIVHRDISPDNIFITRQKQIKLLDFGAARYAIGEHSKSLTSILKPGYAPMEQYSTKGNNQGPWSDVYAVAATIYRAVTGQVPTDAMERIQGDTIKTPRQLGIDIPLASEFALMKGLALKAVDRYESVPEFQDALLAQSSQSNLNVAGGVIEPQRTTSERPSSTTTIKPALPDNYRDYGADSTNPRIKGLKIAAGIFVLLIVIVSFKAQKKAAPPAPVAAVSVVEVPAISQNTPVVPEPVPVPMPAYVPPPQPVYTPPPASNTEANVGRFKYLASNSSGEKFYYDSESYRRASNGNVQAMTIIVNRRGDVDTVHKLDVDCNSGVISIDNGRYNQINSGSIGGAMYENFCNR